MLEAGRKRVLNILACLGLGMLIALAGLSSRAAAASAATGEVYAFGQNLYGQLGYEANSESENPNPTPGLVTLPGASGPVAEIAAGEGHSLAVTSTGQLYAFGDNFFGQLGSTTNSSTSNANSTPALVTLPGATGPVTQVAAGANHSLVVTSSGQLYAFGLNRYGQLGSTTRNGTEKANPTPTLVSLSGATGPVTQVAAGESFSLAVTSTGQLYAFGLNNFGQLGIKTNSGTEKANPTPTLVSLSGATGPVTQVAAGATFSLAVTSTGQLYAFGLNHFGQLGSTTNNGTQKANPTPTLVSLPGASGPVTEVAAGAAHSLVVTSTGQLYAFGENLRGQLGSEVNSETSAPNPTPTLVTLLGATGPVTQVAAGHEDSLAVTSTGELYAFGENLYGQLGNATNDETEEANPAPALVLIPGGGSVDTVARGAAALHTLALVTSPAGSAPTVETGAASSVTRTAATLSASVDPDGATVSACRFEYGPTTSYGSSVPCSTPPGGGDSAVTVSAQVTGLTPNTTYHFRILATNPGGTSDGVDHSFTTQVLPPPSVATGAASSIAQSTATLNATVNPNGGEVSECRFEYGTSTSYGSSVACAALPGSGESPVAVSAPITGLVTSTTYHFRVVATSIGGTSRGSDGTFSTLPSAPTVTTGAASSVTQTAATLNATVNPNGGEVSECTFEYGTSTSYGSSVPCSTLPGDGDSAVAVSAPITGLSPNTTYFFRIVATGPGGTSDGVDQAVATLPNPPTVGVATGAASSITETSATLNAIVNPNGGEVSECTFEYGTSTSYGSSVPCAALPGDGESAVPVSAPVTGLAPNTTYFFRIVATNPGGTSFGADQSLTTQPVPALPAVATAAASSITRNAAKLNAIVNPDGSTVSECELEYGTTASYGSSAPCSPSPGSGEHAVTVSGSVVGLAPATTYHFRIMATNAVGTAFGSDQTFTTLSPLTITTASLAEGQVGSGYAQTLTTAHGTSPFTWSLSAGSLPAGLHLNAEEGVIVGTPTAPGTSLFTVKVTDTSTPTPQVATANLSINVIPAAVQAAEYGQCVPQKNGNYSEAMCQTVATRKGKPDHRGKWEFVPGPAPSCVAKKKGEYTNSECTTKSVKAKKGRFEKEPGPGYTSTTGTVTLASSALGSSVVCAGGTGTGEITGPQTGVETITFTGCEMSGKPCMSEGPDSAPSHAAGVIITNLLDTRLVGPVSGQVWTELVSSGHEPYLVEFGCKGPLFRAIGSLSGVQAGDVNAPSFTSTTTFAIGEGEQALYTELSDTGGTSWVGPDPSTGVTVAINTGASKTEIKT